MIVSLKNIGTIHEASFDLDKDLIVFIGPNNTGKTYAAYCLYGLRPDYLYLEGIDEDIIDALDALSPEKVDSQEGYKIDIPKLFSKEKVIGIHKAVEKNFLSELPVIFGDNKIDFQNTGLNFSYSSSFQKYIENISFSSTHANYSAGVKTKINKDFNSVETSIFTELLSRPIDNDIEPQNSHAYYASIIDTFLLYFFNPFGRNNVYFLPAERIGVSIFEKDFLNNRFSKSNELLASHNIDRIVTDLSVYSKIIQDAFTNNSRWARLVSDIPNDNELAQLANELEQRVLKGSISTNKNGEVYFSTSESNKLKLNSTGSVVKSLTMFILYLKSVARPGDTLIFDEPEINLHPDNQRLVARILAKLSKLGVKVIVSTHSDYFIRELNNLIMLNKEHPETKAMREKYGYNESEILDHKRVGAYLFKNHTATPIEVTEAGMEAATIDEEINKLNNTQNDIYWTLFEE